jgi:hypothetical protein
MSNRRNFSPVLYSQKKKRKTKTLGQLCDWVPPVTHIIFSDQPTWWSPFLYAIILSPNNYLQGNHELQPLRLLAWCFHIPRHIKDGHQEETLDLTGNLCHSFNPSGCSKLTTSKVAMQDNVSETYLTYWLFLFWTFSKQLSSLSLSKAWFAFKQDLKTQRRVPLQGYHSKHSWVLL